MEAGRVVRTKKLVGVVVKDKMDKTVVVEVENHSKHRQYKKYISAKKRYKAHDEENRCRTGDKVLILEARPLSKEKRWVVKEVLKKEELILAGEEVTGDDTGQD
jgi:small subunit ribosomal protein S17